MLTEARQATAAPVERTATLLLDDFEAARLRGLAAQVTAEYRSVANPEFLAESTVIAHELPRRVRSFLNRARLDDIGHTVVVSGHALDALGPEPTPRHWREADTERSRAYAFLLMLHAALLGDVIGWATQQDGRLVTDVLPIRGQENSPISSSSHAPLGWHTEDAFSPSRGDHIGLLCLRNPDRTTTTVSHVVPAALGDAAREVLAQARFLIEPDPSHSRRGGTAVPRPVPVLTGPEDAPQLCVDRDYTSAVPGDAEAERALAELVAHIDANLYELPLRPGDLCFVDNRTVVHGRSRFRPRYDGTDRWLKRVNVVTDLRRTRPERLTSDTRVVGR
ncbi:guanitoxin biosynthesis L-enduracididine beta-hydroxylase GntD [Streptomyces triticirhizae]|uniref:TauD/TfdA-like domain-containing protein n=1 Tax=Streptomyces triticirhizae TaxID=2483353 RepID=A0A3M2M8D5_9ACTN|nr:guanitoxin biosynthesis L-enduracididine beta-hydroxylase GntD [Streptomyces triticirhizae]RMI43388.1 hypothetical protein EBN88_07505 [Streptomyces triticirhizae]